MRRAKRSRATNRGFDRTGAQQTSTTIWPSISLDKLAARRHAGPGSRLGDAYSVRGEENVSASRLLLQKGIHVLYKPLRSSCPQWPDDDRPERTLPKYFRLTSLLLGFQPLPTIAGRTLFLCAGFGQKQFMVTRGDRLLGKVGRVSELGGLESKVVLDAPRGDESKSVHDRSAIVVCS